MGVQFAPASRASVFLPIVRAGADSGPFFGRETRTAFASSCSETDTAESDFLHVGSRGGGVGCLETRGSQWQPRTDGKPTPQQTESARPSPEPLPAVPRTLPAPRRVRARRRVCRGRGGLHFAHGGGAGGGEALLRVLLADRLDERVLRQELTGSCQGAPSSRGAC